MNSWLKGYQDRMLSMGKPEKFDEYARGWLQAEAILWHQENQRKLAEMRARIY